MSKIVSFTFFTLAPISHVSTVMSLPVAYCVMLLCFRGLLVKRNNLTVELLTVKSHDWHHDFSKQVTNNFCVFVIFHDIAS